MTLLRFRPGYIMMRSWAFPLSPGCASGIFHLFSSETDSIRAEHFDHDRSSATMHAVEMHTGSTGMQSYCPAVQRHNGDRCWQQCPFPRLRFRAYPTSSFLLSIFPGAGLFFSMLSVQPFAVAAVVPVPFARARRRQRRSALRRQCRGTSCAAAYDLIVRRSL